MHAEEKIDDAPANKERYQELYDSLDQHERNIVDSLVWETVHNLIRKEDNVFDENDTAKEPTGGFSYKWRHTDIEAAAESRISVNPSDFPDKIKSYDKIVSYLNFYPTDKLLEKMNEYGQFVKDRHTINALEEPKIPESWDEVLRSIFKEAGKYVSSLSKERSPEGLPFFSRVARMIAFDRYALHRLSNNRSFHALQDEEKNALQDAIRYLQEMEMNRYLKDAL